MKKYSLSFLLGNLLLHRMSDINNQWFEVIIFITFFATFGLLAAGIFTAKYKQVFLTSGFAILFLQSGFLLSWASANTILSKSLPESLEKQEIVIQGFVDSIPVKGNISSKFNFLISKVQENKDHALSNTRIRLSWYSQSEKKSVLPQVGEFWQLKVKLKRPSGIFNPGGFDYERWLFQQRIRATGYVRNGIENIRLNSAINNSYLLDHWREKLSHRLDRVLQDNQFNGLLKALILGLRSEIEPTTWQVFIDSGTNHLMAISGLHIGLLAAIGFFLGRYLWSIVPQLLHYIPAQQIGAGCAILFALAYSALAGFSIPTQRALIMLVIAMTGWFVRKRFPPELILSWTLILVLLHDPISSLSLGFWLSFMAVAIILLFSSDMAGRRLSDKGYQDEQSIWRVIKTKLFQYASIPIVLFFGLLPLSVFFFERFSLLSPLANFFAVPWVSLLIIPLSLLGAVLSLFSINGAQVLFGGIEVLLKPLFDLLKILAEQEFNLIYLSAPSLLVIVIALYGAYISLKAKKRTIKLVGGFCLIPLFIPPLSSIPAGHFHLSALDVGQGLALIIRTEKHLLVYDTGNAFNDRFNMADVVLLPYLRHFALTKIDKLVLSHADNDHIGAAPYLLRVYSPSEIISGEVERLKTKSQINAGSCFAGQSWRWDGVLFKVLSPDSNLDVGGKSRSNDRSCVIWIRAANGFSALLTGDAESAVEKQLVKNQEIKNSNVLIVGHHGSKTSSSLDFVKWINPEYAIFTYGYKNRYNFPAKTVLNHFKQQNTLMYATINGTIDINSNMSNNAAQIREYRKINRRYWNRAYISLNK